MEQDGLSQPGRGSITIIDRKGLEQAANGAYGTGEAELGRFLR